MSGGACVVGSRDSSTASSCVRASISDHIFSSCRHLPARFVPNRLIRIHTHEFQKRVPTLIGSRAAITVERILKYVCRLEVRRSSLLHGCPGRLLTAWSIARKRPAGKTIDN